jgi:hypothetical protein
LVRVPPGEIPDDPPTGALNGPPTVPSPECEDDGTSVVRVVAEGMLDEGLVAADPDG